MRLLLLSFFSPSPFIYLLIYWFLVYLSTSSPFGACVFKEFFPQLSICLRSISVLQLFPPNTPSFFWGNEWLAVVSTCQVFIVDLMERFIPNHLPADFWSVRSAWCHFLSTAFHDQLLWEFLGQQSSVDPRGCKPVVVFYFIQKHESNRLYLLPRPLKCKSNSYLCVPF